MVFSKSKIYVNQNIENTFQYLNEKKYLKKFFPDSGKEVVEIIGGNQSAKMEEGEEFDLMSSDEEMIITFRCKVLCIEKNKLIKTSFQFVELIDKEEGTLDDDLETTNFLQKFVGGNFGYDIILEETKGKVKITEISTIKTDRFLSKVFFKIIGLYYKIRERKIYKKIKTEIEAIQ